MVEVCGVAKGYSRDLGRSRRNGLSAILGEVRGGPSPTADLRDGEFWALHGIDLVLEPGASLGVLGRNGAGKSTLLRLVSGISRPTLGEIRRRGRVSSLLDVNAGFDPLLTGVENVEVAFTLMSGAPPSRAQVEEVIGFAGIGEAARHPVRTYSQGMRMRLGFSVAVHVDPDVLIIDEAISVGDTSFQLQCTEHLRSFRRAGGSLLFTTHSTLLFQLLASSGMHLVEGRVCCTGTPEEVAGHYLEEIRRHSAEGLNPGPGILDRERITRRARGEAAAVGEELPDDGEAAEDFTPLPGRPVTFERVSVARPDGSRARTGEDLVLTFDLRSSEAQSVELGFTFWTADLAICVAADLSDGSRDHRPGVATYRIGAERFSVSCEVAALPLRPGRYAVRAAVHESATGDILGMHGVEDTPTWFDVEGDGDGDGGDDAADDAGPTMTPLRTIRGATLGLEPAYADESGRSIGP